MKKIIIGALAIMFVICGIGAILFLNKGNETKKLEDAAPKIQGVKDISIQVGEDLPETVKDVKANEAVKDVTIDISRVDTTKPGEYPIIYIYVDNKGNEHKKEITCTVTEPEGKTEKESSEDVAMLMQSVPKTGDSDWLMVVHIILLMASSAVFTSVYYLKNRNRKI